MFLPKFKSTRIITEEELKHVSRYIYLNPSTNNLIDFNDLETYPWSSYSTYIGIQESKLAETKEILKLFDNDKDRYKKFVESNAEYQKTLEYIKRLNK